LNEAVLLQYMSPLLARHGLGAVSPDISQIEIPQCSGCCRAKMAYQPRTVGDKVMILPTWSGYTDG
jgi:hypothetical protein